MRIVWDERKRIANIAKHGLDFADLDTAFLPPQQLFQRSRIARLQSVFTSQAFLSLCSQDLATKA